MIRRRSRGLRGFDLRPDPQDRGGRFDGERGTEGRRRSNVFHYRQNDNMRYTDGMPARAPPFVDDTTRQGLRALGEAVRTRRKAMRLAAQSVARAANMNRQTLNRIERGEPSVTAGAYINAMRVLGLDLKAVEVTRESPAAEVADVVRLGDYPQLNQLAWHRAGETVTEKEALALYERNWRHVDQKNLSTAERSLVARLVARYGNGVMLV